jgi:hypothetical protein
MSADIIDGNFPLPDRPVTRQEVDKIHAEAFRNLENAMADCVSMAKIAADHVQNAKTEDREMVFAGTYL